MAVSSQQDCSSEQAFLLALATQGCTVTGGGGCAVGVYHRNSLEVLSLVLKFVPWIGHCARFLGDKEVR